MNQHMLMLGQANMLHVLVKSGYECSNAKMLWTGTRQSLQDCVNAASANAECSDVEVRLPVTGICFSLDLFARKAGP